MASSAQFIMLLFPAGGVISAVEALNSVSDMIPNGTMLSRGNSDDITIFMVDTVVRWLGKLYGNSIVISGMPNFNNVYWRPLVHTFIFTTVQNIS